MHSDKAQAYQYCLRRLCLRVHSAIADLHADAKLCVCTTVILMPDV